MNITIQIPSNAVADVELYCELQGIDLQQRIQQEVNKFIKNIIWYVEEARKEGITNANTK